MEAEVLSYSASVFFLLIAVNVYKGYLYQIKQTSVTFSKPNLSLIISVKNEEQNILTLVDKLDKQNYPIENYEVIFVDDCSSDRTYNKINELISGKINFTLLKADNKKYAGKKGALDIGISSAKYNLIVITDADCKPEQDWLLNIANKLDYGYDFVFGIAPLQSGKSLVKKISAFQNLKNTFLTISAVGLNIPYSAAARNFAFRKKSFERIGGYSNTTETLSGDDDLLLREALKNKMLIGTITEPGSFVFSDSPNSFDEYFAQKKRHLKTSHHYLLKQKFFLAVWHLTNLFSLLSIFLAFISAYFAIPFTIKIIYDFYVLLRHQQELGHSFKFYELLYLIFIYEIFVVLNFINSISGKVEWK